MPTDTITFLGPDGIGGARLHDGRTLRVPGVFPGESIAWEPDPARPADKRTVWGELSSLQTLSMDRRDPPCPFHTRCGGCDWGALQPEAQRLAKAERVQRAFRHDRPVEVQPSPRERGYRARISLTVQGQEVGYRPRRTHDLVAVDQCGIARPELEAALGRLRDCFARTTPEGIERVELRSDGFRAVYAFSGKQVPAPVREALASLGDVSLEGQVLAGDPVLTLPVAGLGLRASPGSFYQVNLEANQRLVDAVVGHIGRLAPERVLDLYAGIGNFSFPIAATGVPVLAVEVEGQATADAQFTAAQTGLGVTVLTQDARSFDPSRHPADVVLLDPPRAGAGKLVERLLRLRPRALVYVACNPVAAARDLRPALSQGYRLTHLEAFDLFPDTHHAEALIVCER